MKTLFILLFLSLIWIPTYGISVTSPNGGETLIGGTTHNITWIESKYYFSIDIYYYNGSEWIRIMTAIPGSGSGSSRSYEWRVPYINTSDAKIRIIGNYPGGSEDDYSDGTFTIKTSEPGEPEISINRNQLNFGGTTNGIAASQSITISNSGYGVLYWFADSETSWIECSPNSGSGSGTVTVSVDTSGLSPGTYTGVICVIDQNATNSPQNVSVTLTVYSQGQTSPPFGEFATPIHGSTVSSSVPVTGWVLDDIEVTTVKIYNGTHYVGDAIFVEGARPDVEQDYPEYPMNYQAGWGYMLLTNFLPNGGNGTFTLYAKATDIEGNEITLGAKTIICDNANAVKPFGAIDTPTQGGTVSGSNFINWGWVLTPQPNGIPTDGSTINVWVDGVNMGYPTYNNYREDIATLFSGYANSNGAVGYFYLDTTAFKNGVHTIQWTASDNAGNSDGIGSRYFTIQNTGTGSNAKASVLSEKYLVGGKEVSKVPLDSSSCLRVESGFFPNSKFEIINSNKKGSYHVKIKEVDILRIRFPLGLKIISGNLLVGNSLRSLPPGFNIDNKNSIIHWMPGPAFLENYHFVFIVTDKNNESSQMNVIVNIGPKFEKV